MYSSYGIAFDGNFELSFGEDFVRNAVSFVIDNSSSSHADNLKNNFFYHYLNEILLVVMKVSVQQKKSLVLILVKQTQNFA